MSIIDMKETDPKNLTEEQVMTLNYAFREKYDVKTWAFRRLFSSREFLLKFYKDLYPKDKGASGKHIERITLDLPTVSDLYDVLGFVIGDRFLILAEAHTWGPNTCLRMFLSLSQVYKKYMLNNDMDLDDPDEQFPGPELYLIYTGSDKTDVPERLSLNEIYWGGASPFDARVSVISKADRTTAAGQYITFCKTYDAQREALKKIKNGRERDITAMANTAAICMGDGVLTDFLDKHEAKLYSTIKVTHDIYYLLNLITAQRKAGNDTEKTELPD